MNNLSAYNELSEDHKTEKSAVMYFGRSQIHPVAVYSILGVLTALLFILTSQLGVGYQVAKRQSLDLLGNNITSPVPVVIENGQTAKLIEKLKFYGLWTLSPLKKVPRFFIKSYPSDLHLVKDISIRKKIFLHSLLPHALFVRQEVLQKRKKLESILGRIDCGIGNLDFGREFDYENQCSWTEYLADEDVNYVKKLSREYRTTSAETLLERVDAVPVSIILAQGALESYWGGSRFTREGNSIFGMWTWKTPGIVPFRRDEGKNHKVKIYESILASVRAYQLTLNRLEPYEEFRKLRLVTDDPLTLAEGLDLYSERGEDYIEDIKKVILSNNLQRYDGLILNDISLPEFAESFLDAYDSAAPGKASL